MAITRRQFVTRLGALAAAAGFSQAQASQIMEAVAYDSAVAPGSVYQGHFGKPRVVWIHGAECTGCSTSLLSAYENLNGIAVEGTSIKTVDALSLAATLPVKNPIFPAGINDTTLHAAGLSPDPANAVNIADILIDVIDLLYHETVMSMGGDLAYQWLTDFKATNNKPFVLVVEGALQDTTSLGAWWETTSASTVPWCSVAHDDAPAGGDIVPAEIVQTLGESGQCAAIIAIGQCACFGGYPGCKPPISNADAGFDTSRSQTDAKGVYQFLSDATSAAAAKVVNVPGCPTNPWWFVLSVVCFLVDAKSVLVDGNAVGTLGILGTGTHGRLVDIVGGVDGTRRLKAVYSNAVHSAYCSKFRYYAQGVFAQHPGDKGCLMQIGCKGPAARSLCATHGWNNQQPTNIGLSTLGDKVAKANPAVSGAAPYEGGNCTRAGHPCMACTEKGYPDSFVPFVVRS